MKKCIIIANGRPPTKKIISYLKRKNYTTIFCADGGFDAALKLKITPDYVVGDFDSLKNKNLINIFPDVSFIHIKRQNDTDVEKCLKIAIKKNFSEAVLLGATGERLDHTICNLGIVLKYFDKIKVKIISEHSLLIPYTDEVKLKTEIGEMISIFAFDNKTLISSKGLKYPLTNSRLQFGIKESTSNQALKKDVHLKIKNGTAFIIRDFENVKKNGLF